MKTNFDALMQAEIKSFVGRKKLLLHCCCAPCASSCLERLKDFFDITVLFYNPNIERAEYFKRLEELKKLIAETGWASLLDSEYSDSEFYEKVKGLEKEKEGGKRCEVCFDLRLTKTRDLAEKHGFDFFATTLTLSPLKNAELINEIGFKLQEGNRTKYLPSDFKKRGGYQRSLELSKEYNLYRQNYCGCAFSRTEN